MKKNVDLYFPCEVNMLNNENVSEMIDTHGPKGFGAYILILSELRQSAGYTCGMHTLNGIARWCKIRRGLLESILYDFDLFILTRQEDTLMISSPYLNRVMEAYDEKMQKLVDAGKIRSDKGKRNQRGQFTSNAGALDNIRLDKTTSTTVVVEETAPAATEINDWETYLDEAIQDEAWMELLAMNSGMSKMFVRNRDAAVDIFRQHVNLQGKNTQITSVGDIKAYFANFLRPGTPTNKHLAAQLTQREEALWKHSPYRFETIDPETGERTYYGNPIPADAPPRPNDNAVWTPECAQWV